MFTLDLTKLDLTKLDMPKFDMPKLDMPKFDMPKLDMPKLEMPTLPVEQITSFARDAAYVGVGATVVAIQTIAQRVRELAASAA